MAKIKKKTKRTTKIHTKNIFYPFTTTEKYTIKKALGYNTNNKQKTCVVKSVAIFDSIFSLADRFIFSTTVNNLLSSSCYLSRNF